MVDTLSIKKFTKATAKDQRINMKKYCLTDCFKRKLSKSAEYILDWFLYIVISFLIFLGLTLIVVLLGFIVQMIALFLFDTWRFHYSQAEVGASAIFLTLIFGIGGYLVFSLTKFVFMNLFSISKNLALNVIAPEQAECRIFEECKSNNIKEY